MSAALDRIRSHALSGAMKLLAGESQGFAIDATAMHPPAYVGGPYGGSVAVKDLTTPANNLFNVALDASNLTQAGTSPKHVIWNDGHTRWTPHNLLTVQSEQVSTWTGAIRATITSDTTVAPDGNTTADTIACNSTSVNGAYAYAQNSVTTVSGFVYTFSVYLKAGASNWALIEFSDFNLNFVRAWFNLGTGALGSTTAGNWSVLGNTITPVGGNWYRCTVTASVTVAAATIVVYTCDGDASLSVTSGASVIAWGAQVNRGYAPTNYLKTIAAARYGIPQEYDVANSRFGLLVEPAATNLVQRSEQIDNAYWTKDADCTITADNTTSPDGISVTADKVAEGVAGTAFFGENAITTTASVPYTFSLFLKTNSLAQWMILQIYSGADTSKAWFDIQNGVLGATSKSGIYASVSSTMTAVGNGWYRCAITSTSSAVSTNIAVVVVSANGGGTHVNNNSYFAWGAQFEQSGAATSYIPTIAATVTRAVDKVGALLSTMPSFSSLSAYHQVMVRSLGTTNTVWVDFDDGTTNNFAAQINNGSSAAAVGFSVFSGAAQQAGLTGLPNTPIGTMFRGAFRCAANDFNDAFNGTNDIHDTAGSMPASPTVFCLGGWSLGTANCGANRIYNSVALPRALSDAELQARTVAQPFSPGALGLLTYEPQGFAIDATSLPNPAYVGGPCGGTVAVKDLTTPANNLNNVCLDQSNIANTGTSPKVVPWNDGTVRWTPHNIALQSQTLDNAVWSPTTATVTANAATAPDGTTTAEQLALTALGGYLVTTTASVATLAGVVYTYSVYAKYVSGSSWFTLQINDGGNADAATAYFNLGTGALGSTHVEVGSPTIIGSSITAAGNGWYRCSITLNLPAANASIILEPTSGDLAHLNGANGTTQYFWGAQCNRGYSATPYLVTTSAARYGIPQLWDAAQGQFVLCGEPAATNVLTYSQTFSNAVWVSAFATLTDANATGPDGIANTAATLNADGTTNIHRTLNNCGAIFAAADYTVSIFAKQGTQRYIQFFTSADVTPGFINFDLQTGTFSASGGTGQMVLIGNGWYRCSWRTTMTGAVTGLCVNIVTGTGAARNETNTLSGTVFLWGMQAEAGSFSGYPTTYIPTLSASVARATDIITAPIGTIPYSTTVGTFWGDYAWFDPTSSAGVIIAFSDGTQNNREQINASGRLFVEAATVTQADINLAASNTARHKVEGAWNANDFEAAQDGTQIGTDVAGSIPAGITTVEIGTITDLTGAAPVRVWRVAYVPRRKPSATLLTDTA